MTNVISETITKYLNSRGVGHDENLKDKLRGKKERELRLCINHAVAIYKTKFSSCDEPVFYSESFQYEFGGRPLYWKRMREFIQLIYELEPIKLQEILLKEMNKRNLSRVVDWRSFSVIAQEETTVEICDVASGILYRASLDKQRNFAYDLLLNWICSGRINDILLAARALRFGVKPCDVPTIVSVICNMEPSSVRRPTWFRKRSTSKENRVWCRLMTIWANSDDNHGVTKVIAQYEKENEKQNVFKNYRIIEALEKKDCEMSIQFLFEILHRHKENPEISESYRKYDFERGKMVFEFERGERVFGDDIHPCLMSLDQLKNGQNWENIKDEALKLSWNFGESEREIDLFHQW